MIPSFKKNWGNRLLAALSPSDLELLRPHLEPSRNYPVRHVLEEPDQAIKHIYFMDAGFASVVGNGGNGQDVEIGLIGRDGVSGSAVVMGDDRSPHSTYIQMEGTGRRLPVAKFLQAMESSRSLRVMVLKSVQGFMLQATHTAIANARASLEQRLARWLLMAHDRADGDSLRLTHEFLAMMLAVRRPGVTEVLNALARKNLVGLKRAHITILNRDGIEKIAGEFYGVPESAWVRLMSAEGQGAKSGGASAARAL
jgi:CRP-like cAMP-binding protein